MMEAEIREKLGYACITIAAGAIALLAGLLIIMNRLPDTTVIDHASAVPIVVPSDSIKIGIARKELVQILGEPDKISAGGDTYYYYRRLEEYNRDQILVIQFAGNEVVLIDSNINLGEPTCIPATTE